MRDKYAPIIEGFDLSGLVNRYSLQCEQFYVEGDNGGTLLDGSTVTDALAAHVRLSWTLNSLSAAQYAALTAALDSGESPDTVRTYAFDPSCNAVRCAKFHVTRPLFQFAFDADAGQMMSFAGGELVLEEAAPVARFEVTPPTKTAYEQGDALDLAGLSVTQYDPDGAASDITADCAFDPAAGSVLRTDGAVTLTVSYDNAPIAAFPLVVAPPEPVAHGDWWTLYDNGWLDIYCVGDMPNYTTSPSGESAPWHRYAPKVSNVTMSSSATSIGKYAFHNCTKLSSVTIGDSVTSIGVGAFYQCNRLVGVTIPDSVTSISYDAFRDCSGLTDINVSPNNPAYSSVDGVLFNKDRSRLITYPKGKDAEHFTIPDSVTSIGENAFEDCDALTSVTIPDSVTSIALSAFRYCGGLTSVTMSSSVTTIGNYAFDGCVGLADVYYSGSQEQWTAINMGSYNTLLRRATIHYNSAT